MTKIFRILIVLGLSLVTFAGVLARDDDEPQLNVSHIECADSSVEVHFVLVHSEASDGAPVLFTLNGQPQVAYWQKFTGGVNHYTNSFTQTIPTTYTIAAASLVYDDETIQAHNLPFTVANLNCHPTAITLESFTAQAGVFPNSDTIAVLLILAAIDLIALGLLQIRRARDKMLRERLK